MPSWKRLHYQLVGGTDPDSPSTEETIRTQSRLHWGTIALSGFLGAGIAAAIFIAVTFVMVDPQQCPPTQMKTWVTLPCGNSSSEAKAAGCIFDPMMNSWLSEDCYDEELSQEFRSLRDWAFYNNENATRRLTEEEFSQVGDSWGTWEYHIAHCAFALRKLQRAVVKGRKIEQIVAREEHTTHCADVTNVTFRLMEKAYHQGESFSLQDMGTILHTGYPMCIDSFNILPYSGVVL